MSLTRPYLSLPTFIESHTEKILSEWETFARSLGSVADEMSIADLRDHALWMLRAIVMDMRIPQTDDEQEAKGKGETPEIDTSASAHGTGRHQDGFNLLQLTAEFRALRASVLRLWLPTIDQTNDAVIDDLMRFNEAIDQAIAESVTTFADAANEARDVFLAMLGHDLRSPLHAIALTAAYFERDKVDDTRRIQSAKRIGRSAVSMTRMVNDLLEFSRLRLGGDIPVVKCSEDLVGICRRAVDEARVAHPNCTFDLESPGSVQGTFDADRLGQVFANLLNNAHQYRAHGTAIDMTVETDEKTVVISVHNEGVPIPLADQQAIFSSFVQLKADEAERPRSSVGLGLYIAQRIVESHGGELTVNSSDAAGTTFSARLPRQ